MTHTAATDAKPRPSLRVLAVAGMILSAGIAAIPFYAGFGQVGRSLPDLTLSIFLFAGFFGLWLGRRWGRWLSILALIAWVSTICHTLLELRRFHDPEVIRLAWILLIGPALPPLGILLLGIGFPAKRSWRREGLCLAILALALTAAIALHYRPRPFGYARTIRCLAFHPDGTSLAAAGWDGITLWNVPGGEPRFRIRRPHSEQVAFSPDGHRLYGVLEGYDNALVCFNATDGTELARRSLKVPEKLVTIAVSADGRYLAAAGRGVAVVSLPSLETVFERAMDTHYHRDLSLSFTTDGTKLAIGSQGMKSVLLLQIPEGRELWRTTLPDDVVAVLGSTEGGPLTVALRSGESGLGLTPDGRIRRSGPESSALLLLDLETGAPRPGAPMHSSPVDGLASSRDARFVGCSAGLGEVHVFDFQAKSWVLSTCFPEVAQRTHGATSGNAIAISPDGRWVASAGDIGRVVLWDLSTGEEPR